MGAVFFIATGSLLLGRPSVGAKCDSGKVCDRATRASADLGSPVSTCFGWKFTGAPNFQPTPTRTATATASNHRLQSKWGEFSVEDGVGPMMRLLIAAAVLLTQGQPAQALLLWNWSYTGAGVSASGTFTTNDAPDAAGFYQIVGITGADNGAAITGLQPTGTSIPGNAPYAVDNLVSAVEPRLTAHGFGFSLANGDYANPFNNGSNYYEYLSVPPYENGAGPEKPVSFSATIVPEPSAASLMLAGLIGLIWFSRILNRRTNLDRYPLHRRGASRAAK
jgi:hypothetical protein